MIVLGIDTATPATVIGLRNAEGAITEARDDPSTGERPGHSTRLLPLAAELLDRGGLRWSEIDRIAVGVGPGTFTGLRVGVATAHGLALSSKTELMGVSSLRALALGVEVGSHPVLAAIDARRGEVFVAGYQGNVELLSPRPVAPPMVPALLAEQGDIFTSERCIAVGDGAVLYRPTFEAVGAQVPEDGSTLHRIRAAALCELAVSAIPNGDPGPVLPDYLRRPDAAIALEGSAR